MARGKNKFKVVDNWGYLEYYWEGEKLDLNTIDMLEFQGGYDFNAHETVPFFVDIRGETVQINDMGHRYDVNTNVLYVEHEENGFVFVMDVRQVADKVVGVLFKD